MGQSIGRWWRERGFGAVDALVVAVLFSFLAAPTVRAADDLPGRVGRISEFAGQLYLAPQDKSNESAAVGVNYPITNGDTLWVSSDGRAEIDLGIGQFRIAGDTSVQVTRLDDHQFALFVASGRVILRLRTLDPGDAARVDTPHSQIEINRPGLYRVDVATDRQETTVIVREGEADVRFARGVQQTLPGQIVTVGGVGGANLAIRNGYGVDGFDAWSDARDRRYDRPRSTAYVSSEMVGASDLDAYGTWETYPTYGAVWFPPTVAVGWAPYRYGHWAWVEPWGWTWIDDAAWGYAPFHYGRWVWFSGRWGWCPGRFTAHPVWAPALVGWYGGPGWAFSANFGGPVYGWVPLGWGDPYYPHFGCSTRCWQAHNRPYAVNVAERPGSPPTYFTNSRVPGAITAVSGAVLAGAKPVAKNIIRVPAWAVSSAPALANAPAVKPSPLHIPTKPTIGAPPPASRFYPTTKPAMVDKPVVVNAPRAAPDVASQRMTAPKLPTPADGGRVVSAPPLREARPAPATGAPPNASQQVRVERGVRAVGPPAVPAPKPQPGPDRGIALPPTIAHPAPSQPIPAARAAPAQAVPYAPPVEGGHPAPHAAPAKPTSPSGNPNIPGAGAVPK